MSPPARAVAAGLSLAGLVHKLVLLPLLAGELRWCWHCGLLVSVINMLVPAADVGMSLPCLPPSCRVCSMLHTCQRPRLCRSA